MAWLSPWMLLGLGALAVPVLVHLVQRESRSGRQFPSLMFLQRVPFESRRRKRLRDLLLLALRAGALIALVLAFAGPVLRSSGLAEAPPPSLRDTVLLVDVSYSMSSPKRWAEARDRAAARVDAAVADGRVALLAFDDQVRVLAPLARDATALERQLSRLEPGRGGTRFADALDAASALLLDGAAASRHIVLVSDLQQSALSRSGPLSLPEGIGLEIEALTAPLGGNLALLDAHMSPAAGDGTDGVAEQLLVSVRNTGDEPLADRSLSLSVNGLQVDMPRTLSLAAGQEQRLSFPLVLAADRPTRVELRASPDSMPADDVRYGVFSPRRPIRAALAQGPEPRRYQGVYLEQALAIARSPAISVRRISAADLSKTLLAPFDVLLLDDVEVAQGAPERALRGFVRAGGGVFVSAGPDRAGGWEAAGDGLVPGAPRGVLQPAATGVIEEQSDHPLWALAGAGPGLLLRHVSINSLMGLVAAANDRVLARVEDGTPLLLERRHGAGRVMVLATTADPRWSTLALSPGFVPLAQSIVTLLADRRPAPVSVRSGQVVDLLDHLGQLPGDTGWRAALASGPGLIWERPDGSSAELAAGSTVFRALLPGIHELHRRHQEGPALPVAVNPDPAESLLEGVSPQRFQALVARRHELARTGEPRQAILDDAERGSIPQWLLLLAAALFASESLLTTAMSRRPANEGVRVT